MCIASVFSEFLSPHNRESIFRCQGYSVQTKFSEHCRETNEYCYVPEKLQNIMGISGVLPNMYISMDTTEIYKIQGKQVWKGVHRNWNC